MMFAPAVSLVRANRNPGPTPSHKDTACRMASATFEAPESEATRATVSGAPLTSGQYRMTESRPAKGESKWVWGGAGVGRSGVAPRPFFVSLFAGSDSVIRY